MKTKVYLVKNILGIYHVYSDKDKAQETYKDALHQVNFENARYPEEYHITDVVEHNYNVCNRMCKFNVRCGESCSEKEIFILTKEII